MRSDGIAGRRARRSGPRLDRDEGNFRETTDRAASPTRPRRVERTDAMIVSPWVLDLKQDGLGGAVSALVSIPLSVGFGMFAFSALGDEYIAVGAVAGLYTTLCVGLASVLLGDRTKTIYAPRITSTFFIGLLLSQMVHSLPSALKSAGPAA